jgi:hypothetical protein
MSCLISPPIIHKVPANFTQIIEQLKMWNNWTNWKNWKNGKIETMEKLNNFTRNFAWKQQPSQIASLYTFGCASLYFEKKAAPFDLA